MVDAPKHIQTLTPYSPGKPIEELAREKKLDRIVKLASNENPLGPSPNAIKALEGALRDSHRYSDPSSHKLVKAVAKKYGKKQEQIICGHGTDSILAYVVNAFTGDKDEVLTSEGTFIGIYVNTLKFGRTLTKVPLKEYAYDLQAILDGVNKKTRLIYLANPNNPTGTMFDGSAFENFMQKVPPSIPVVLDEAYSVYAEGHEAFPNGLELDYDNLIVTRTFSKAHGLAGLRAGFAVAHPDIIRELYKVKLPFEPNLAAQTAAAAALNDDEFLTRTKQVNEKSLTSLRECFDRLGIRQLPSTTNFILIVLPSEEFAAAFNEECLNRGLIVRHVKTFGIPEGIRINSGTDEESIFAIGVIEKVYKELLSRFDIGTTHENKVRT